MIYIIRHGKTELNKANVLQGRSDYPLTEEGIQQAKEAAKKLEGIPFSHVFTSPLVRASDTASIVAPGIKPVTDHRLIEMDYGPYEGMSLLNPAPEVLYFFKDFVHHEAPEGMEPLSSVVKRAGEFIQEIKDLQGNILISTHAILMKGILEYLTPDSNGSYWSRNIGNCAIYAAKNVDGIVGIPAEI